jgi:transcriptional regulator with XRE-family HTH domain
VGAADRFQNELREVGRAVRAARKARGWSQEVLAERAGFQRNYIGRVERGERNANLSTLIILARALEIPPAEFLKDVR